MRNIVALSLSTLGPGEIFCNINIVHACVFIRNFFLILPTVYRYTGKHHKLSIKN